MKARIAVCGSLADGVRVHERKGAGWAMTTASLAVTIQPGFVSQDNELVIDIKKKQCGFVLLPMGNLLILWRSATKTRLLQLADRWNG